MSRGKRERLKKGGLFVPLIFSFGAVLEDMPLKEFLEDPTKLSNTLRTIQNYFQVDGVVCYGDTTVLAESLGCRLSKDSYPPVVEPLGEKMDIYASTSQHSHIVARIDAERGLEPAQQVNVYLAMDKVHIFESDEAGRNLSLN